MARWTGNEAELNRRLRERAMSGHGVLTRDDLRDLEVSPMMIHRRRRSGLFVPVLRGVVALPGTNLGEKGRWRAAVAAGGRSCFLTGQSALALHGLVREHGPIRVVRASGAGRHPDSRWKRSENFGFSVYCHQARRLEHEHLAVVDGIPTVTVERGLLAYAAEASPTEIGKALSQAERERNLCWDKLREMTGGATATPGIGILRHEVENWEPAFVDASSDPEEDMLRLIRDGDLPMPEVNVRVGEFVIDFLWRSLHLAVEMDPYGTHKGYESFHRDRRKSIALERMGLRVIRFTWEDRYRHPDRTLAELREIIRQQASLHGNRPREQEA